MFDAKLDPDFLDHFERLPKRAQKKTRAALKKWRRDNNHNSLEFKALFQTDEGLLYALRVDGNQPPGCRMLGVQDSDALINWYWVGPHDEYERLLASYKRR